jgi:hypothetical protein
LENFHHQMEKHDILLFKMETPFQLNRMSCWIFTFIYHHLIQSLKIIL